MKTTLLIPILTYRQGLTVAAIVNGMADINTNELTQKPDGCLLNEPRIS